MAAAALVVKRYNRAANGNAYQIRTTPVRKNIVGCPPLDSCQGSEMHIFIFLRQGGGMRGVRELIGTPLMLPVTSAVP